MSYDDFKSILHTFESLSAFFVLFHVNILQLLT